MENPTSLEGVDSIGIDEFAVRKGHVYKTIVVDLKSGRILHVGQGKAADALAGFWKRVRCKKLDIKYIATDLSAAFISSVYENCPNAVHVFDHFHVVKLMNEKLDEIRRAQYNMEKDINKRKVLKGTRYLLLRNGADIFDKEYKTRLDNAVNDELKNVVQIEHTRHRSIGGFAANLMAAMAACSFLPKKPSLNIEIIERERRIA